MFEYTEIWYIHCKLIYLPIGVATAHPIPIMTTNLQEIAMRQTEVNFGKRNKRQTNKKTHHGGGSSTSSQIMAALNLTVRIHPLVLFQVVDAYERRNVDSKRVIGTLLGKCAPKKRARRKKSRPETNTKNIRPKQATSTRELLRLPIASAFPTRSTRTRWRPSLAMRWTCTT